MAELKSQSIGIVLDERIAEGEYSNLVLIAHSTSEFILDFASLLPNMDKARVKSRIILPPEHAKRLLYSLQENVKRYEESFGKIPIVLPSAEEQFGQQIGEA